MNKTIEIKGMSCSKCEKTVKEALMAKCLITDIRIEIPYVYITLKKDMDNKEISKVIEEAGYEVVKICDYFIPSN